MEITYASPSAPNLADSGDSNSNSSMATTLTRPVKIIPLLHPNTASSSSGSGSGSGSFLSALFSKWKTKVRRMSWHNWIELFLPCYRWIRTYKWREYLQVDLMSGTTVGVMLVPQAMSYAKLAGLDPIYGLYSGFVPLFVYAIFGSSRQLAVGPVALVSLLVSNVLGGIVDSSDELYTELAILLALMVGILECIMGLLRLGWLIRFISHSVISGFTSASAVVIALSQAKYFLGYDIVRSSKIVPLIESIIAGADGFSWPPFVMGSIILAILVIMKHLGKSRKYLRFLRAAGPLTAVVLGTTFVKIFHPASISLVAFDNDEERSLLSEPDITVDRSWRLNFDGFQVSTDHQDKKPPRGLHDCCLGVLGPEDNVAEYYQQQAEMLEGFNAMDELTEHGSLPSMSKEERDNLARSETFAIRISNIANMFLFAAKVYASVRSGSLAIIASTLDSLLDLLSGFILWFTAFSMKTPNPYQYPIGKRRMQPLGILVFASVMATLGLQIILESIRMLLSDESDFALTKEQEEWVIGIMLSVTLVKLGLVLYCRSFTNEIVKAYALDHFFDVITNIIGLIAALLANYIADWMDPVGAIILAVYTIRTWSMTVLENVNSLVGRSAAPEYLQKLTYLCWNHDKAIKHIDTVRAYTFGSHYFVEVDIVLPADMPLQKAHDIGESLQEKLEHLPEIERAFVHLDYEYSHKPEHAQSHLCACSVTPLGIRSKSNIKSVKSFVSCSFLHSATGS